MKVERTIVILCTLYSVLCTPLSAQSSFLSIGVRGGGQTWLPSTKDGIPISASGSVSGGGVVDLRYTYYHCFNGRVGLGFAAGAGIGYGQAGLKGTVTEAYTKDTYDGYQVDYSIQTDFIQRDQFGRGDANLMVAFCAGNFTFNTGPRFMVPFANQRTLTITKCDISAKHSFNGGTSINNPVLGKLETPYSKVEESKIPQWNLLWAMEAGWEWYIQRGQAIGLQVYADIDILNGKSAAPTAEHFIMVSGPQDQPDPRADVKVTNAERLIANRRFIDFGVRLYYAFSIHRDQSEKPLKHARDTRDHHNRYLGFK